MRMKWAHDVLTDWTSPEIPVNAVFLAQRYLAPWVRCFVDDLVEKLRLVDEK